MPANLENSAVATGLEKVGFHSIPKKGNARECSNYPTFALISHASKVMLKILKARLQQYVNRELPDVQAGFRRGRGTRDQTANIHWIMESREFQKSIYFCFIDYAKDFDWPGRLLSMGSQVSDMTERLSLSLHFIRSHCLWLIC